LPSAVTIIEFQHSIHPLIGTPDAWEQKVLADFDQKAAAGAKPETLETAEIVTEPQGKYFRYMKAVPTGAVCLACHGPAEKIGKEVKEQLSADYPHDKATGYGEGQIRGAITIKRPLGCYSHYHPHTASFRFFYRRTTEMNVSKESCASSRASLSLDI